MLKEGTPEILMKWKLQEKADKLPILHYHGAADPLFQMEPLKNDMEKFWPAYGFKNYLLEFEDGLGHKLSAKGFERAY